VTPPALYVVEAGARWARSRSGGSGRSGRAPQWARSPRSATRMHALRAPHRTPRSSEDFGQTVGGYGSGGSNGGYGRAVVEHTQCLSVRALVRQLGGAARRLDGGVTVHLSSGPRAVRMVPHPMRFGGVRWYALCPCCDRRCLFLYLPTRARRPAIACRSCAGLVHASTRYDAMDLAVRRVMKLRARLAATGAAERPGGPMPWKPPRMRWKTYERLCAAVERAEHRANVAMLRRFC
jgi:hypothetical protein